MCSDDPLPRLATVGVQGPRSAAFHSKGKESERRGEESLRVKDGKRYPLKRFIYFTTYVHMPKSKGPY